MKESYGEGLANYTSLESCGNCSNAVAEALTEGSIGGLLSSEITNSRNFRSGLLLTLISPTWVKKRPDPLYDPLYLRIPNNAKLIDELGLDKCTIYI